MHDDKSTSKEADRSTSMKESALSVQNHPKSKSSKSTSVGKSSESKINLRINLMVILISSLYIVGNLPYSIYYLATRLVHVASLLGTLTYFSLYLYNSVSIFIFYFFNNNYRNILNGYVAKIFCLLK